MELTRLEQIVAGAELTPLTRKEASLKKAIKRGIEEPKSGGSGGSTTVIVEATHEPTLDEQASTLTVTSHTWAEIKEAVTSGGAAIQYEDGWNPGTYFLAPIVVLKWSEADEPYMIGWFNASGDLQYAEAATEDDYPVNNNM